MPRPNWYNDNINRAFPFEYKTVGISVPESGTVTMGELPDDFIADCGFTIGPSADFNNLEKPPDSVYLNKISRVGNTVLFEFITTEGSMADFPLIFTRDISDEEYTLEYLDSDAPEKRNESISDSVGGLCREPFWSGYLVTGDMSSVASRLSDGGSIFRSSGEAIVEPALVENLSNSIVNSFELANSDRTRSTSPDDCDPIEWPFVTGLTYVKERCIQGDVKIKAGYNVRVSVNLGSNTITLSPAVGSGAGSPCGEVSLFDGEVPPDDATNNLFEGGLLCNEVIRAINGLGGPNLKVVGGQGVSVSPDLENNCINIDVNFLGLDLCAYSYTSESL
jgi:hypothetical protein